MKRLFRILTPFFLLFSLTGCDNTTTIDGVTFNVDWDTYYPSQTTYVHYDLGIDSCPNYIHYEIKSFKKEYDTWYSYLYTSNGMIMMSHYDFKGLIITTTNDTQVFLKKDCYRMFIDKCPYCTQE